VEQDNIKLKIALETLKRNSHRYLTREEDKRVKSLPQKAVNRVLIVCPLCGSINQSLGTNSFVVYDYCRWFQAVEIFDPAQINSAISTLYQTSTHSSGQGVLRRKPESMKQSKRTRSVPSDP